MPLLLADTVTVFVPVGQVMDGPGDVPQPPVQLSEVSVQEFGSRNPSCAPLSATPNVEFASKISVVPPPPHDGRTDLMAPNASARPAPNTKSGLSFVNLTARPRSRSRTVPRAT